MVFSQLSFPRNSQTEIDLVSNKQTKTKTPRADVFHPQQSTLSEEVVYTLGLGWMNGQVRTGARQKMMFLAELGSITDLHLFQIFFISSVFSDRKLLLELQTLLLFAKISCCVRPSSVFYISARSTCKVQLYFPLHTILLCYEASLRFCFLIKITHMEKKAHGKCCCFHLHSLMQWLLKER